jgi:hypothetical protein
MVGRTRFDQIHAVTTKRPIQEMSLIRMDNRALLGWKYVQHCTL